MGHVKMSDCSGRIGIQDSHYDPGKSSLTHNGPLNHFNVYRLAHCFIEIQDGPKSAYPNQFLSLVTESTTFALGVAL